MISRNGVRRRQHNRSVRNWAIQFAPTPTTPRASGRPNLNVQVYTNNDNPQQQVQVGGQANFRVVIRNQGNAEATGIELTDRYQQGLSHSPRADQSMTLKNDRVGSLAPGESRTIDLSFNVTRPGRLCHDVSVTCNQYSTGEVAKGTGCVNAVQPEPQGRPNFEVVKDGPRLVNEGDTARFRIVIRNTGDVPLNNLLVVDEYDRSFSPQPQGNEHEIVNGNIQWRINRMGVGATKTYEVPCTCLRAANNACGIVKVTDDSGLMRVDNHCLEIAPGRGATNVVPGGPAAGESTLRLAISPFNDTVRAGTRMTVPFYVENTAATPEQQVQLRIQFPPEFTPDLNEAKNSAGLRPTFDGNVVTYPPIAELRNGERLEFVIPMNVNQSGVVNITAELRSRRVTTPIVKTQRITIVNR